MWRQAVIVKIMKSCEIGTAYKSMGKGIIINSTIQQAITCLDNAAMQIVIVIDKRKELVG